MSREWNGSEVMSEFLKVAEKSGLINSDLKHEEGVGNPTKETPVKGYTRNEPTEEYGLKTEPKDIVEKAHPEQAWMAKESTPVHSMGNGSLVENIKEQQEKDIEIATKMPHGTLIGVHANIISELVKLANSLEDEGKIKEASRVDEAIKKISYPFSKGHLHKQSGWFLLPLLLSGAKMFGKNLILLSGGFAGVKMFGKNLTSKQENLKTDMVDLYEALIDKSNRSKSANAAAKLIASFLPKLNQMDLSTKEGSDKYAQTISELDPVFNRIKLLIMSIREDIQQRSGFFSKMWGETKDFFGFEDYKLIDEKFEDLEESFKEAKKYVFNAKRIEQNVLNRLDIESKLNSFTFLGKNYTDLEALEIDLNKALQQLHRMGKIKKPIESNIIQDGKLTSSPETLREVIDIIERNMSS